MNRLFVLTTMLTVALLLGGCAKKMNGRYVADPDIPIPSMAAFDAKTRKQMEALVEKTRDMNRMYLEFNGSKVWMGTTVSMTEYRYSVKGDRLEVIAEAGGQKTVMPMKIETDGSITYQTFHFYRAN